MDIVLISPSSDADSKYIDSKSTQPFIIPGMNSDGDTDWVLILTAK